MKERVFVSGTGAVTSYGIGTETLWDSLLNGVSAAAPIPDEFYSYHEPISEIWAPLPKFDWRQLGISRADEIRNDPLVLMSYVAVEEAIKNARLEIDCSNRKKQTFKIRDLPGARLGVSMGTGLGGGSAPFDNYVPHLLSRHRETLESLRLENRTPALQELTKNLAANPRVNPYVICQTMPNAVASNLGIRYGALGMVDVSCFACAASTIAIKKAVCAIQQGEIDVAIAGGSEFFGDRAGGVFMGFDILRTLAKTDQEPQTASRPFDANRTGFLFSEGGAGALILESEKHLEARKGEPIVEIVGSSISSDSTSIVSIDPENNQIAPMLLRLLKEASLEPSDITYINAHGTGTTVNDAVEASILQDLFPSAPIVNASKSLLGHTVGACGALESIITILSLSRGFVHPNLNITDPIAELNFPLVKTEIDSGIGLTQNMGFGGHNASLLFRR